MKIENVINQHRFDFSANMRCEFCDDTWVNHYGYSDNNYYHNVIPNMKCKKCGKSTNEPEASLTPPQAEQV